MIAGRKFCFVQPERMTPRQFEAMGTTEGAPYTLWRQLIGGRWHAVDRQYHCGSPVYYARKIIIRMPVPDRAAA